MRALVLLSGIALCLAGCAPLEPDTTWEEAWGALDQEELRVSLRIKGTLARPFEGTAPPAAEELSALVSRQLAFAPALMGDHALVDFKVDAVVVDGAQLADGRLTAGWTVRVSTRRPAGSPSDEASTLAFALSLPEDPVDVLARGGAACSRAATPVDSEAALAASFDPARTGCMIALASAEVEVVEATAMTADARACRPASIDVARGSASQNAQGFSFIAKVTVAGTGLEACDIRQLATVQLGVTGWDGAPIPDEELRSHYGRELWDGLNTGRWVVDSGWDWEPLHADGKHRDDQIHNVDNRKGTTADGLRRTEVQLDRTTRRFLVQVRDRASGSMRAIRQWRYSWSNDGAKLPDRPYGGMDVAIGQFRGCLGITGLGELNTPADDCP